MPPYRIVVRAPHLHALTFRVLSGAEDFTGYGALFEGDAGIVVDNYSIRSNNGQAMFWTNPSVNAQIDALVGYDLVILQYGLNIMQAGVLDYSGYGRQIEKMVAYVRQCFPKAAVLILGVSDRSVKTDRGFEPMDAVPRMTEYQRRAAGTRVRPSGPRARRCARRAAWSASCRTAGPARTSPTSTTRGGRRIARALVDALNDFTARHASQRKAEELRIELGKGILTPQQRRRIERWLLAKPRLETLKEPPQMTMPTVEALPEKLLALLSYDASSPLIFSSGLFLFLFAGFMLVYSMFRRAPMARIVYVILFSLYFYYKSSGIYFPAADLRRHERLPHRPRHGPHRKPGRPPLARSVERRGEPRHARLLQVHQLPDRHRQPDVRAGIHAVPEHLPARRHLVLRLPVDELHDRRLPPPAAAPHELVRLPLLPRSSRSSSPDPSSAPATSSRRSGRIPSS